MIFSTWLGGTLDLNSLTSSAGTDHHEKLLLNFSQQLWHLQRQQPDRFFFLHITSLMRAQDDRDGDLLDVPVVKVSCCLFLWSVSKHQPILRENVTWGQYFSPWKQEMHICISTCPSEHFFMTNPSTSENKSYLWVKIKQLAMLGGLEPGTPE